MFGICFVVVSSKKSPAAITERIEAFLKSWRSKLVFDQPFDQFRDSLIASKLQKDTTLRSESARHWSVLAEGRDHFARAKAEAEALQSLTLDDCLGVFDRMIAKGGAERACLLSRVYGGAHREGNLLQKETLSTLAKARKACGGKEGQGASSVEAVEDLEAWRAMLVQGKRECYPSLV